MFYFNILHENFMVKNYNHKFLRNIIKPLCIHIFFKHYYWKKSICFNSIRKNFLEILLNLPI